MVLEHSQRRAFHQRGDLGDRAWLGDDQRADALGAAAADQAGKVEAGRAPRELGQRHLVVGLGRVATFDLGPARLRDPGLEIEDRLCACSRVRLAGEVQHIAQMLEVLRLGVDELCVLRQIIIAVGHAEAGLEELKDIFVGRLVVLADEAAERGADAALHRIGIESGETRPRLEPADLGEPRFERRQALRVDRGLIHEAGVGRADPAVGIL